MRALLVLSASFLCLKPRLTLWPVREGLEPDGVGWAPPSAAVQASIQSSYIQSHREPSDMSLQTKSSKSAGRLNPALPADDRLGLLESELAYYREEVDSLQVLVHALGENSKSVPQVR